MTQAENENEQAAIASLQSLQEVLLLFQEASLMNPDSVDPDLQTGLGRADQRCSQQQMSANIWDALRIAVSTMDRPDLSEAAEARDLDLLMGAFHLV
ncbi:hypothetical protein F7725_010792 [Dissostichus mawsoni]|uniref:Uncharacterized protein n=1 Tax=Dissostichus mawsoni TaxID=36200 RepID=A0A7J5Z8V7_DISMA|nr:hypothetical protein F7725_010792 [Dissostichus mawsoni]